MSTERTSTREFIIVGQDQGGSFRLWDIAPAPADPTVRAMKLEEINVDVFDAFGDLHLVWAETEDTAIATLHAELSERHGLDDYEITDQDGAVRAPRPGSENRLMSTSALAVEFTPYGPDHFPEHTPFARRGYLFTVPGSFPADTPAHTNVVNTTLAVYRRHGGWEVRETMSRDRRVRGQGPVRPLAVAAAFDSIAAERRERAAEIRERRVKILGLEPVPPYSVESTPDGTVVHNRCGCDPEWADHFETETDAADALTSKPSCTHCKRPRR